MVKENSTVPPNTTPNHMGMFGDMSMVRDIIMGPKVIEYGTYKIVIENFPSYYFAAAIRGSISTTEAAKLRANIIDFIKNTGALHEPGRDGKKQERVSQALDTQFIAHLRTHFKTVKVKSTNNQ